MKGDWTTEYRNTAWQINLKELHDLKIKTNMMFASVVLRPLYAWLRDTIEIKSKIKLTNHMIHCPNCLHLLLIQIFKVGWYQICMYIQSKVI